MLFSKIRSSLVFVLVAAACLILPFSHAWAAPGNIQATISAENGDPVRGATVEVSCNGSTYATLGTTSATGTIIGDPTVGTTCVSGQGLLFRVSSSTFPTQLYPIIGTTLLPFYARTDIAVPASAISGSTNIFKFGVDTTSTYALRVWNAGGDASVLPFPTGTPDYTLTTSTLAYNWGPVTSPFPGINEEDWFVEATKTVALTSGWYQFEVASDDGTLVTLDGATVIDDYFLQAMPGRPYVKRLLVTGGTHTIDVKYYEHTGYTGLYFRFFPIDAPSTPLIEIGSPISSPVNDRLNPSFGIHTDTAGSLSLSGSCTTTSPVAIGVGTSTITLAHLEDGTYGDCHATLTDPDTTYTASLSLASFVVAAPPIIHIGSCTQLEDLGTTSTYYAVDFLLDSDIDCDGVGTTPITWGRPFIGVFDGGGHSISNFVMDNPELYTGLFDDLNGATVKNITFASGSITGLLATGVIAGHATDLILQNVTSSLDITSSPGFSSFGVGGFVGNLDIQNSSTTAWSNVNSTGAILGRGLEGGLVGRLTVSNASTFTLDTSRVDITVSGGGGAAATSGGLFGSVGMNGTSTMSLVNVTASTNISIATGSMAGGLIGLLTTNTNAGATSVSIDQSTVSGSVTGAHMLGGLIGYLSVNETGYPSTVRITHTQADVDVTSSGGAGIGGFIGKLGSASANAVLSSVTFDSDTASGDVSGVVNVGGFIGGTDGSGSGVNISSSGGTGGLFIYNSSASGNVTGNNAGGSNPRTGGFIGYLYCRSANPNQYAACVLRQNSASGNVTGYQHVGGFVGLSDGDIDIEDSYSTGNVTGAADIGGFMGQLNSEFAYANVSRVYASSTVTTSGGSPSNIGGLIGSTQGVNGNTNVDHAFSITLLDDPSGAASHLAWMIGSLSGLTPAHLAYNPQSVTTANCIGTSTEGSFCTAKTEASYFFDSSHDPLSDWNTTNVWQTHVASYPTLRNNTVITFPSGASFTNIDVTPTGSDALVIWETNEHTTTNIVYGRGAPVTTVGISDYPVRVLQHRMSITSLSPCLTYHFVVTSIDPYGTASTSTEATFQTTGCGGGGAIAGGSSGGFSGQGSIDPRSFARVATSTTVTTSTNSVTGVNPLMPQVEQTQGSSSGNIGSTQCFRYVFTKDLKPNAQSADVQQLQSLLNTHGAPVTNSGPGSKGQETTYYGTATKQALLTFQKVNQLPATGLFASTTRIFIQNLVPRVNCATRPATSARLLGVNMHGADVRALQHFLNTHGFLLGPTAIESRDYETGFFGQSTKKALQAFQKAHRLPETGQVDAATAVIIGKL